jgi:hypothetical protein
MNVVTIQRTNGEQIQAAIADVRQLVSFLWILEQSPDVKAFKVTLPEVGLVTDLKYTFGVGHFAKFVTVFNWTDNQPQTTTSNS